jgi:hypothetical protein
VSFLVVVGGGFPWYTHKTMMFVKRDVLADLYCSVRRVPKSVGLLGVAVTNEDATGALWVQLSSFSFWNMDESD